LLTEFIPANQIIPTTEGILKFWPLAKEQTFKSTFEILLKEIGKRQFLRLVDEEKSVVTAYSRNWYHCFWGSIIRDPKSKWRYSSFRSLEKIKCNSQKQAGYVSESKYN
jgi:sulfite reductase (ferredoxin)